MATSRPGGRRMGASGGLLTVLGLVLALAGLPGPAAGAGPDSDGDGLRDAFELANGFDPARRDTDGDGLRDPVEDEDDDRLGALGEQRAHTSARLADTDADGIRDGREDADGDGVDNAHEQDRRPLPRGITPPLARARKSVPPTYPDGCHTMPDDPDIDPCEYGEAGSDVTVVVFGDSHATQWMAALVRAAPVRGWRLVNLTKSSCPAAVIEAPRWDLDPSCTDWRAAAFAWIAANPPALVVMSSSRMYRRLGPGGRLQSRDRSREEWAAAIGEAVRRLPAGVPALIVAGTPRMHHDIPVCLAKHRDDLSRCSFPRSEAIEVGTEAAERAVVAETGARYRSFNRLVCPYDPCPALDGEILIWRDQSHITRRMSEALWRSVGDAVADALAPPSPGGRRRGRRRGHLGRPTGHGGGTT